MKRKPFILLLTIASVCACAFGISACGDDKGGNGDADKFTFDLNEYEETYTVVSCDVDSSGKIEIPSKYKGKPVTSIGDSAFGGCSGLTSITIPDSVTSIGNSAFSGCSSLTSVTIPDSVTSIGDWAFSGCNKLSTITIPTSMKSLGNSAFSGCSGLTSITIPANVTSIGYGAFSGCSGLTSITIPANVTSIGDEAFSDCSGLTSITVESGNTVYHSKDNCLIETANKVLILGCKNSIMPNDGSVTSIGDGAFLGCSGLTSVTIPDRVTSIGSSAFYGCNGLTSITIPDGVTSIGYTAFSGCSDLTSVTIGNSVTSICSRAFSGCSGLTSVYYKGTEEEWANITIDTSNEFLTSATIYYYSETEPAADGNFWHYDTDGVTPVIWNNENAAA